MAISPTITAIEGRDRAVAPSSLRTASSDLDTRRTYPEASADTRRPNDVIERSRIGIVAPAIDGADLARIDPRTQLLPGVDAGGVAVAPVEAETPGARQLGIGDRDRLTLVNPWRHRLIAGAPRIALGARACLTQRAEVEAGTYTVLEEDLDVRLTVHFDGFDVMLGHVTSVPTAAEPQPLSTTCPTPIPRAWLRNRWDDLAFVHWAYDPADVQALLPDGLRVDTFDDGAGPRAWVSLVPFRMRQAGPSFLPALPWISTFAETNVRTYVVDAAGHRAVWFLSLDAARLPVVAFARWTIGFPYVWSTMTIERSGDRWTYETARRRWPRSPGAATRLIIEAGAVIEPTALDEFLTARWGTVAEWRGQLRHHPVDHPPWTLRAATIVELDDSAVTAAGLSAPTGDPIARLAAPIDARFGRPVRV